MRLVPILLLLAACNTPGPHFRNVPATRITVEGSSFDVRVRDDVGEAIRTNSQYAPRFGPIASRAKVAIELASGCLALRVRGDQAQILAELDCAKGTNQPQPANIMHSDFECLQTDKFVRSSTGEEVLELDCRPIR